MATTKTKTKKKTKTKTKAKTTKTKAKPKKKASAKMSPAECYDTFMSSVKKAEDAKTAKTRDKWIKVAQKEYQALLKCEEDDLSAAKLRRAKRTNEFLDELEQK